MISIEILEKAIAAHAAWKAKLRSAAIGGKLDTTPAVAKADNQCVFGKWLYGPEVASAEAQSEQYRGVRELHAEFHRQAGRVLEFAAAGNCTAAEKEMSLQGSYTRASSALTMALVRWRENIR